MPANQLSSINHIVVLMLENRSFDHMLGLLYSATGNISPAGQLFEGLTGNESNPGTDGSAVPVFAIAPADSSAYFMPGADPGEGYAATNFQLFGSSTVPVPPVATNNGFVRDFSYTLGWEAREKYSIIAGTTAGSIMGVFPPAMLPILSGLARGFAVCDYWFGSVPTETLPNRAFVNAGTSQGHMDDKSTTYTCPSIYSVLSAHGVTWGVYGYDAPPLTRMDFTDLTNAADSNFGQFSEFRTAAANGSLPSYAFLEPSWGASGNSQHPNYNVALGEQLIYDVYYAVRNGPAWNQTLLIVTYDEHGGCYDHVPPPSGAVPPDNSAGEYGFDFTRFGPRVPAVLVSPLIPAGTVFRVAADAMPLDHTSILKTIETRWNLPALSKRDAAASSLSDVLTLATPRTDDPLQGVAVPVASGAATDGDEPSHLQEVYAELVSRLPVPDTNGGMHQTMPHLTRGSEYDAYIRDRISAWIATRQGTSTS